MVEIITTYGEKGENVKTGEKVMMAATVLNCTLVDVLAFKRVAVQSKGKIFKCLFFQCFPTSTLARKNIQRCRGDLCKNLIFKNLCFQQDKLIVNLQCRAMISTHQRLHIRQTPFKR